MLFENTSNFLEEKSIPFVSNVFASRGLCAIALGIPYEDHRTELIEEFTRREQNHGHVERVTDAPCHDVVWEGDEANLWRLPIPMHHKDDVGPYLTMACVMKGLDQEFYDITFTKNWAKAPRRMSVSAHGHHHLARILAEYEKKAYALPLLWGPSPCLLSFIMLPYAV